MADQFHITLSDATTVAVSTVFIYLAFIVLVRLAGPRSLSSLSLFDFACVVALGAVVGRSVLLDSPTVMIGVVALITFFVMQRLFSLVRHSSRVDHLVNRSPVLLVSDGRLLNGNLRRARVAEDEVRQAIRQAGIHNLSQVGCVVLERNGALSVIGGSEPIDPWLLADLAPTRAIQVPAVEAGGDRQPCGAGARSRTWPSVVRRHR